MAHNTLVEVRVPTYKRPDLLRRALRSLVAQTHPHWVAVVLDDSPEREAAGVCHEFADRRIHHSPNPRNLGMAQNISLAFRPTPFIPESRFACVLEDDNAFEPRLLEWNCETMNQAPRQIMARNYVVVEVSPHGGFTQTSEFPMADLYGDRARPIPMEERLRKAFHSFAVGNLAYFWRLHSGVDLSVAEEPFNSPVAESRRAVSFLEPCWYEPRPQALFSRFVGRGPRRPDTPEAVLRARCGRLGEMAFYASLLRLNQKHGDPSLRAAFADTATSSAKAALRLSLAEAGHLPSLAGITTPREWWRIIKGIPLRLRYGRHYWKTAAASSEWIRSQPPGLAGNAPSLSGLFDTPESPKSHSS